MQKYNCKNCGAELYWDANAKCLKCEYCDEEYQVSDFEQEHGEKEKSTQPEQADEHAHATDESVSVDLVVYKCSHCGAEIVTAKSTVATTCAYCGRAISISDKLVDRFKPDVVIPFLIDEAKAREIYGNYVKRRKLVPKTFKEKGTIKKIKGIFVPFWLHSFVNETSATVYGEKVSSSRRGDDKIVTRKMYHINIEASGTFKDMPTDALKHMDNELMDALEPFDYQKLKSFNPAYMAGFYAEEYDENEEETLNRAKNRASETMLSHVESEAGDYSHKRIEDSKEKYRDVNSKYAMFPVWMLNVPYKDKEYVFAINGETGKIVGKLPLSGKKVFSVMLRTFLISSLIIGVLFTLVLLGGFL